MGDNKYQLMETKKHPEGITLIGDNTVMDALEIEWRKDQAEKLIKIYESEQEKVK
jgi:hypothetical protein